MKKIILAFVFCIAITLFCVTLTYTPDKQSGRLPYLRATGVAGYVGDIVYNLPPVLLQWAIPLPIIGGLIGGPCGSALGAGIGSILAITEDAKSLRMIAWLEHVNQGIDPLEAHRKTEEMYVNALRTSLLLAIITTIPIIIFSFINKKTFNTWKSILVAFGYIFLLLTIQVAIKYDSLAIRHPLVPTNLGATFAITYALLLKDKNKNEQTYTAEKNEKEV